MEPELVKEVCELRLRERNRVLDQRLHDTVQAAIIDLIRDFGIAPKRILHFGTGSGEAIEVLRAFTPRVLGCDMSAKTLTAAQRPNAVVVAPEGLLPFATGALDLVHALFVMHFKVPASMLRELRRCSAPNGFLVANCYGDGVEPYREQMRRAGWDLIESRAVPDAVSHVVDLWTQAEPYTHMLDEG